jgi:hypothetical protein
LANEIPTQKLYDAYCEYTRRRAVVRVQPLVAFGKVLTKLFGSSRRLAAQSSTSGLVSTSRPVGYFVPDARALHDAVHKHLKTRK